MKKLEKVDLAQLSWLMGRPIDGDKDWQEIRDFLHVETVWWGTADLGPDGPRVLPYDGFVMVG